MTTYEVIFDLPTGSWRVEAIAHVGTGAVYRVTMFYGPDAKERAEEYAAWKQAGGPKT